jgi:hypothetical protein
VRVESDVIVSNDEGPNRGPTPRRSFARVQENDAERVRIRGTAETEDDVTCPMRVAEGQRGRRLLVGTGGGHDGDIPAWSATCGEGGKWLNVLNLQRSSGRVCEAGERSASRARSDRQWMGCSRCRDCNMWAAVVARAPAARRGRFFRIVIFVRHAVGVAKVARRGFSECVNDER